MSTAILLYLFACIIGGDALQWVRFNVPAWVKAGQTAVLTCEFHLQGDPLYSVKWYKRGREIYRYVPGSTPFQESFEMAGVVIDEKRSHDQQIVLQNVDFNSTGRYKCEVLTDAPFFKTLVKSSVLQVVQLPEGGPIISGMRDEYQPGDFINMTCSTSPSVPPATLTWFINDHKVILSDTHPSPFYNQFSYSALPKPIATTLRLTTIAKTEHFQDGGITFLCQAQILNLHDYKVLHTAKETSLSPSFMGSFSLAKEENMYLIWCIASINLLIAIYQNL